MTTRNFTFDAVGRLNRARDTDEVLSVMRDMGDELGFQNFCVAGMPEAGERFEPYVLLSGWPDEWLHHYDNRGYVHIDPVIAKLRSSAAPFDWREAHYDKSRGSAAARMMNEARELGLAEGFCVPIYSVSGFQAAVSFGGREFRRDPEFQGALHLLAIYAHGRLREMLADTGNRAAVRALNLSSREVECLRWSAEGKTTWEISCILGLSEKTVEKYLTCAIRKLDASNRVHAVAQAFRAHILH